MPKKIVEINRFNKGLSSTVSQTDTDIQSAKYSLNIDPASASGRLEGITDDKALTTEGFKDYKNAAQDIKSVKWRFGLDGFSDNTTHNYSDFFIDYGSGASLPAVHNTLGFVIGSMRSATTSTSNINDAVEFVTSSEGHLLKGMLDMGHVINGYAIFDDGSGSTDGDIQLINNMARGTANDRITFDTSLIRKTGRNVSSGTIAYQQNKLFIPGQAIAVLINDYWFYVWLNDTSATSGSTNLAGGINQDPVLTSYLPENNEPNLTFLGKIAANIDFSENRTATGSNSIRFIVMTAIKTFIDADPILKELIKSTNGVTITNTASAEELIISFKTGSNITRVDFANHLHGSISQNGFFPSISEQTPVRIEYFDVNPGDSFSVADGYETLHLDFSEFITYTDKTNSNKVNIIASKSDSTVASANIYSIEDVYNANTVSVHRLANNLPATIGEYSLLSDDDKVHIGLGSNSSASPKIVMKGESNPLKTINNTDTSVYDSALSSFTSEELSELFVHYYIPPMHGTTPGTTPISTDDNSTPAAAFYADYDAVLDETPAVTLHAALANSSGKTIENFKVGQIFKIPNTTDFTDGACLAWKRYDYAVNASLAANDLFMYCGNIDRANGNTVPVLRFLGNLGADNGVPAFAYGIKEGDASLYKISLASSTDHGATQFAGTAAGTIKDSGNEDYSFNNTGDRYSSISLVGDIGPDAAISSFTGCSSPTLFNRIGLAGEGQTFELTANQDVFYNNGHLKIYYRHGVFWLASNNSNESIYKINAIDFHDITSTPHQVEEIQLNFSNIPGKLEAEGGDGMIRRTMEDQANEHDYDPANANWNRVPQDAHIIGICETFESGRIKSFGSIDATWASSGINDALKIETWGNSETSLADNTQLSNGEEDPSNSQLSRLATGDVVRFAGLDGQSAASNTFSTSSPYTVSVVDDGRAFFIRAAAVGAISSNATTSARWWNSKVWFLYGRDNNSPHFKDWDLFLFNANTIDYKEDRKLNMADRTVPYHQARYYNCDANPASVNPTALTPEGYTAQNPSFQKIYYPGEHAFIRKIKNKSEYSAVNHVATHFVEPTTDITCSLDQDSNSNATMLPFMFNDTGGTLPSLMPWDYFSDFGIYDKTGRWTTNGKYGNDTDMKYGLMPDSDVYGHSVFYQGLSSGPLHWGNNIGWDIDDGRSIETVKNSLHPKVLYSSTYMANILYKGRAFLNDAQSNTTLHAGVSDNLNNALSATTYNTPGHSVTFLGLTTGNFVVNPGDIARRRWTYEYSSIFSVMEDAEGYDIGVPKRGFAAHWNNSQSIKQYLNDLTLYTIDDFSGHRGSVVYTDDSGTKAASAVDFDLDNVKEYTSGIEMARPNYGGPEIENPHYHPYDGTNTNYPFSSVNNGYYDTADSTTNKGWDGYTPPYLFNPGKGYYVYINRSWKSSSNHTPTLEHNSIAGYVNHFNGTALSIVSQPQNMCWNFNYDKEEVHINQHSNRRHNYSSTCIADCITNNYAREIFNAPYTDGTSLPLLNGVASSYEGQDVWLTGKENISTDIDIDNKPNYRNSRFSFWDYHNKYGANENASSIMCFGRENQNIPVAVCTFNKINLGTNITKINNVFPAIFKSTFNAPGDTNYRSYDYNQSYICGYNQSNNTTGSGVLIIRTNFDAIYDKMLRDTSVSFQSNELDGTSSAYGDLFKDETTNINGDFYGVTNINPVISYLHYTGAKQTESPFGEHFTFYAAKKDTDTSLLETINLTISDTNYMVSNITDSDSLAMRQVAVDTYNTTKIRDGLTVFALYPMREQFNSTAGLSNDWIYNTLNAAGDKIYLGWEEDAFNIDNSGTSSIAQGLYSEDSSGVFFTDNDNELITSDSDNTIWDKSDNFVTLTASSETNGTLAIGEYHYKFSFEYDGQYESPLNTGTSLSITNSTANINYIKIKIELPQTKIDSLNQRISGISVYRKLGGLTNNTDDTYYFIKNVPFKIDEWYQTSSGYAVEIYDRGNLGPSYEALNGLPQGIYNTTLNYGLSTSFQGYMYVAKASHPSLNDVERYIFRSQPDNYFSFNYSKDYVIMPETPIAMTSFNSRLYVWGKNKLYKVDPFSLIIEDEFEGISIAGKYAYVKTEFGLCFLDMNNIYLHDGNKPNPIGDPILHSSADNLFWETDSIESDGYIMLEQGYKDLIQTTIDNGDNPNVYYLGRKNAFVVNLSDKAKKGKSFIFNISHQRWDLWESPRPKSVSSSKDADILINDGTTLWNYLDAESKMYSKYNKRLWSWFSKDLTMEANNIDKVFRGFTFLGTPSIYNYANDTIAEWDTSSGITNSIQVYIDNEIVIPKIQNKLYETTNIGNTYLADDNMTANQTSLKLKTPLNIPSEGGGVDTVDSNQTYFRPGHLIKINDEIMLIVNIEDKSTYSQVIVIRGQMGTTATGHLSGTSNIVKIVSPRFKLPARSKGKTISIRLLKQAGHIDSIGISYKPKSVKF